MIPSEQKLLQMLSNNDVTFYIPPYQRNYEWNDDQCDVFFKDVIKTCKANQAGKLTEHFFGSITFFETETAFGQPDQLVLIDGQQRITTTMLFLIAIRDLSTDKEIKQLINNKYLENNNVNSDNNEYKIKLKQVETDWSTYKHLILREALTDREKDAAVYRNYRFFYNRLQTYQNQANNAVTLIEKGLSKFSVITIQLQPRTNSWENPQEIFESMNSLGKPLSLADLVRNYLLLRLDANTQETLYKKYWLHIEQILSGQISNYLRDYMQWYAAAPYKKATESNYKGLYGAFKDLFGNIKTKRVLQSLSDRADIYASILPGGKTGIDLVDKPLKDLQYLRVSTAYSFLFGLLISWRNGDFTDEEMADALDAFRIYCIRRRLVAANRAENKNFPLLVNQIPVLAAAIDKRTKMFELLSNQESNMRLPNDIEITDFLSRANFYNFQYCKFILALVEEKITKSRPNLDDQNLQIEHVMPQTLNTTWEQELGPEYESVHQELVNSIGNLTLIRHNQELGNKSFAEKKNTYETKSGLQIARTNITNRDVWNKDAIMERVKWIIAYLLNDVLPIPDSMRKTNNFKDKTHRGLSFHDLQLLGETIDFIADPNITAKVVSDKEVEFEGKKWHLSPLTKEIQKRRGKLSKSGAYQGAQYWEYDGVKLATLI